MTLCFTRQQSGDRQRSGDGESLIATLQDLSTLDNSTQTRLAPSG